MRSILRNSHFKFSPEPKAAALALTRLGMLVAVKNKAAALALTRVGMLVAVKLKAATLALARVCIVAVVKRNAAALALSIVCNLAAGQVAAQETPPSADAILALVKANLRTRERPPYVVYTLARRDTLDNVPDFVNSYTLRVWCRTSDRAALSRRIGGWGANAGFEFIVPAFDAPLDPGPPTADLLDVIHQTQHGANQGTPAPSATMHAPIAPTPSASVPTPISPSPTASPLRVIGSVTAIIQSAYIVKYAGSSNVDYHLSLEARRDPERNRLTDIYVDRSTYALHRAIAHDRLFYRNGNTVPERFEIIFGIKDDVPVITSIHGQTDYAAFGARDSGEPLHEVDYKFTEISFPPTLPDWYFAPATYGAHHAEFPDK